MTSTARRLKKPRQIRGRGDKRAYRQPRRVSRHQLVYLRSLQESRKDQCTFCRTQYFHRKHRFVWHGLYYH